jgi:hypothetical protein
MTQTKRVQSNVRFFPRLLSRKPPEPEGDLELRTTYDVYHLLYPLSPEARDGVMEHVERIFKREERRNAADYKFED